MSTEFKKGFWVALGAVAAIVLVGVVLKRL